MSKLKISDPLSWLNWNLDMFNLVFAEEGKPREKPWEYLQQIKLNPYNYMTSRQHRTWAVLVEGQYSHHCTIPVLCRISKGLTI